jgi:hypothetical protein
MMSEESPPPKEERYLEKIKELDLIWRINEQIMSFENMDALLGSMLKGAAGKRYPGDQGRPWPAQGGRKHGAL